MRFATVAVLFFLCVAAGCSEQATSKNVDKSTTGHAKEDSNKIADQVVEVSCGQCQLGMDGSGCDLAIRIDGESLYVDGSSIDDHGDAHGDNGLCNCIRKAKVSGEIVNGRFKATSIKVLTAENDESDSSK